MRLTAAVVVVLLVAGCGGVGADPCGAVAQLEAIDDRFREGDIQQALNDNDVEAFGELLDSAAADATTIREGLVDAEGEGAQLAHDAATGFIRSANLFKAAFAAASIRQGDLDAAGDDLDAARSDLRQARSLLDCDG